MYDKYDTYSKEEVLNALFEYINHIGGLEGYSFISERHREGFNKRTWEILVKADEDSEIYDPS